MGFLKNTKALWIIIILLVILNIVSVGSLWLTREPNPVFRGGEMRRAGPPREHFLKRQLQFTEEQQERFDTLLIKHGTALETKTDEIRALRKELISMIQNQEFTEEAEKLVAEIGKSQSELEMMNYQHFKEVMAICNEEQKDIFLQTIRRAVGPHHRRGVWDRNGLDDGDERPWRRNRRGGPG